MSVSLVRSGHVEPQSSIEIECDIKIDRVVGFIYRLSGGQIVTLSRDEGSVDQPFSLNRTDEKDAFFQFFGYQSGNELPVAGLYGRASTLPNRKIIKLIPGPSEEKG